jgi:hypothetical protein
MMTDFKLGRVVDHDARSLNFPAPSVLTVKTIRHRRYGAILDQGQLGSCTGNALAGALNTVPLRVPKRVLHEVDAVKLYSLATTLDGDGTSYPPTDSGSSGLAVCQAGVKLGYLRSYAHAFGFDHYLTSLMLTPVIIGVNWYEGFFNPDANGFISISGAVAGGHEIEVVGYDVKGQYSWVANSWGKTWGLKGYFKIPDPVMRRLLNEQGDVTVPSAA